VATSLGIKRGRRSQATPGDPAQVDTTPTKLAIVPFIPFLPTSSNRSTGWTPSRYDSFFKEASFLRCMVSGLTDGSSMTRPGGGNLRQSPSMRFEVTCW
jgi:hypothetical protein